jgi:hypothetical protein
VRTNGSKPKPADGRDQLAALIRAVTLIASKVAFAGLFAYVVYATWSAPAGSPPTISGPVQGAAAAPAVALAAGYSAALGMHAQPGTKALEWFTKENLRADWILALGVFVYIAVGAACGLTYLANTDETPGLLRTVAVAFGGYVIAYIGTAYRQLSQ